MPSPKDPSLRNGTSDENFGFLMGAVGERGGVPREGNVADRSRPRGSENYHQEL